MKSSPYKRIAILALVIGMAAVSAFAQAGRGQGRVNGIVLDKNGKPVAGAKIEMKMENVVQVFEAVTNKKGVWGIIGLGTGNWEITAKADGYLPVTVGSYVRQLDRNDQIVIKLEKESMGSGVIQDEASFNDLEQGNQFFKDGKYDLALTLYDEFVKKNPGAYQVQLNIGDCYREKGDYEKALQAYNTLIEHSKADKNMGSNMAAKGLAAIGLCYLRQDNFEQAQEYFKKSIEISPQDELLPYNVAEICFSNQKIDEAQKYYEMAAQIKPEWPDPYLKLAYLYLNKGDMTKAAEYLEKFLKLEPESERSAQAKAILGTIKK